MRAVCGALRSAAAAARPHPLMCNASYGSNGFLFVVPFGEHRYILSFELRLLKFSYVCDSKLKLFDRITQIALD